jgi:hypothetical protein
VIVCSNASGRGAQNRTSCAGGDGSGGGRSDTLHRISCAGGSGRYVTVKQDSDGYGHVSEAKREASSACAETQQHADAAIAK